ncbi:MAG TPA: hypothetical protein DEZ08_03100 [Dehalococcoidia bacterium]|nr:hypothetical protein [Dehalococcoidia bacterium]
MKIMPKYSNITKSAYILCSLILLLLATTACFSALDRVSLDNASSNSYVSKPMQNDAPKPTSASPTSTPQAPVPTILPDKISNHDVNLKPTIASSNKPMDINPTPTATVYDEVTSIAEPIKLTKILNVKGPEDNSSFSSDSIIIYGDSDPGSVITINDDPAQSKNDGGFYGEVDLEIGINTFTVKSTDVNNNHSSKVLNIFKTSPQSLFLSITQPLNQTTITSSYVQISGITSPNTKVYILGMPVGTQIEKLDGNNIVATFNHLVALSAGLNLIEIKVENEQNESLSKLISIIHVP